VLSAGDAGKGDWDVVRVFVHDDGVGASGWRVVGAAWIVAMGVFSECATSDCDGDDYAVEGS
jgi:hypothetical protein